MVLRLPRSKSVALRSTTASRGVLSDVRPLSTAPSSRVALSRSTLVTSCPLRLFATTHLPYGTRGSLVSGFCGRGTRPSPRLARHDLDGTPLRTPSLLPLLRRTALDGPPLTLALSVTVTARSLTSTCCARAPCTPLRVVIPRTGRCAVWSKRSSDLHCFGPDVVPWLYPLEAVVQKKRDENWTPLHQSFTRVIGSSDI